jgi:hypothetical protein
MSLKAKRAGKDQPDQEDLEEEHDEGENDDGADEDDKKSRKKSKKRATDDERDESEDDDDGEGEKLSVAQQIVRCGEIATGRRRQMKVTPPPQSKPVKMTAKAFFAAVRKAEGLEE